MLYFPASFYREPLLEKQAKNFSFHIAAGKAFSGVFSAGLFLLLPSYI